MVKWRGLIYLCLALAGVLAFGQTDNTFHVKEFSGVTVGQKLTAAMAQCNPDTAVPCILVLDPSLATTAAGTVPALCAQCVLRDYRNGYAQPAPNTIGCLDGYDHLPCVVAQVSVSVTANVGNTVFYTPAMTGMYLMLGHCIITAAGSGVLNANLPLGVGSANCSLATIGVQGSIVQWVYRGKGAPFAYSVAGTWTGAANVDYAIIRVE